MTLYACCQHCTHQDMDIPADQHTRPCPEGCNDADEGQGAVKLNKTALATLAAFGVSPEAWARANYSPDGTWHGDVCGCPDSGRCANGFHHMREDDCGCLPTLLEQYLDGEGFFAEYPDGVEPADGAS